MKSTAEILREARALIGTPEKWVQRADARAADGSMVDYMDEDAARFCAEAAVQRVRGAGGYSDPIDPIDALSIAAGGSARSGDGHLLNDRDETTHADVLAMFDRAIALAETA